MFGFMRQCYQHFDIFLVAWKHYGKWLFAVGRRVSSIYQTRGIIDQYITFKTDFKAASFS